MYGYIYKTTNKINGKIYVGQKKSETFLHEDYLGSGKLLQMAVNKYGKENFFVELIDTAETHEELNTKEVYWINKLHAMNSSVGYNLVPGGTGGDVCSGAKWYTNGIDELLLFDYEEIPAGWHTGRSPNPLFDASFGKIWITDGKINFTIYPEELKNFPTFVPGMLDRGEEWRNNAGRHVRTPEIREHARQARMKFYEEHSDKKINAGTFQKGNTPTNVGKISITNGVKNKYILLEELPHWEDLGWHRGSTQKHASRRRKNA